MDPGLPTFVPCVRRYHWKVTGEVNDIDKRYRTFKAHLEKGTVLIWDFLNKDAPRLLKYVCTWFYTLDVLLQVCTDT